MARRVLALVALMTTLALTGCLKHSRANYDRVHVGMTRAQVQAILGNPWGHDDNEAKYWGWDGDFEIEFDDNGIVKEKDWD